MSPLRDRLRYRPKGGFAVARDRIARSSEREVRRVAALAFAAVAATIMDGKALAARGRAEVAAEVAALGRVGLATVLVGDDPASDVYVRGKHRAAGEAGIESRDVRLPATTSEEELLGHVAVLNADADVDGLLVQLPLPDGIDE